MTPALVCHQQANPNKAVLDASPFFSATRESVDVALRWSDEAAGVTNSNGNVVLTEAGPNTPKGPYYGDCMCI